MHTINKNERSKAKQNTFEKCLKELILKFLSQDFTQTQLAIITLNPADLPHTVANLIGTKSTRYN
ncbi:hypothetical protein LBC_09140 [Campylobacter sp. 19-13652]|nr:hypothetical protein LBC_09140 [Campylobacter sp. 19-13652]